MTPRERALQAAKDADQQAFNDAMDLAYAAIFVRDHEEGGWRWEIESLMDDPEPFLDAAWDRAQAAYKAELDRIDREYPL